MGQKLKMYGWENKPKHNFTGNTRGTEPRYHTTQWRKLRQLQLARQPYCNECEKLGVYITAKVIDHVTPVKQGGAFFDLNNLQSLCTRCHNSKSGKEKNK